MADKEQTKVSQEIKLVKLNIDGQEVEVPAGTTVLKAAEKLDKSIPHFCYHDGLPIVGQCRMCYVEIEGMPKLATSCSTTAGEGMKVHTDSPLVQKGQNATLEFVLLDHPLDCPICDRGGECKLQDYTYEHGPSRSRMIDKKEELLKHQHVSKEVVLDQERCILCTRCVRFSSHVDGRTELVVSDRGSHSVINVFDNRPMESKFSGNVVDLCPVGALTAQDFRFKARPWELRKHEGICSGCAVGCNIEIHTKHRHTGIPRPDGSLPKPHVDRLMPRENTKVNDWWMCDKGRWGYHFHNEDSKRITQPMIRTSRDANQKVTSFKEMQILLDSAINSAKGPWEVLATDSASHEQIEWLQKLQKSWSERGRKVQSGINVSDFGTKLLKSVSNKKQSPWFSGEVSFEGVTKVVSLFDSYRDLEDIVPLVALKLGQKIRNGQMTWEKRSLESFSNPKDDISNTAYLFPIPTTDSELAAFDKMAANSKTLILWTQLNSRGLVESGIAPLESSLNGFKSSKAKGPLFIGAQKLKQDYSKEFLDYVKSAPFVVVMDAIESELSALADIVLPVEAFYDSRAHATNLLNMKQLSKGVSIQHPSIESIRTGSESPVSASLSLI